MVFNKHPGQFVYTQISTIQPLIKSFVSPIHLYYLPLLPSFCLLAHLLSSFVSIRYIYSIYTYIQGTQIYIFPLPLSGCLSPLTTTTTPTHHPLCHPLCTLISLPSLCFPSFYFANSFLSVCPMVACSPNSPLPPTSYLHLVALHLLVRCHLALHQPYVGYCLCCGSFWPQYNLSSFKQNKLFFSFGDLLFLPLSLSPCSLSLFFVIHQRPVCFFFRSRVSLKAFSYCFYTWPLP